MVAPRRFKEALKIQLIIFIDLFYRLIVKYQT